MNSRIPCSVQMLSRNSVQSIGPCLEALANFDEVIVQDGGSTDGTRECASSFANVLLLDQNPALLDADGRILDFAAMRNESIRRARHDWIFVVDSNEPVDAALAQEVAEIVAAGVPGVYEAFRRFYIDDTPVVHCSWYPALQIRLFHRACVQGYAKPVHERLVLKEGVASMRLRTELHEPVPPLAVQKKKWDRYVDMEAARHGRMPWKRWLRWILYRNLRSVAGITARLLGIWLVPRRGRRMPLSHELLSLWESLRMIALSFPLRYPAKERTDAQT